MEQLIQQFITLWVVIDPIGTVPVFVAVTAAMTTVKRTRIALEAALVAAGVLLFFLIAGQYLIDALGISLPAFQIAGGLILFLFALTMIFGESKPETELDELEAEAGRAQPASPAIFPLAVPSLASPGAMLAMVILTDNNRFSIGEQAVTAAVMLSVIVVALVFMLMATPILRLIGFGGAAIVSRVMGMILAAVAVDAIIKAVVQLILVTPFATG